MSDEPTAAVSIIRILQPEPSILIVKRAAHPDDPWSGHLAFPGGKREPEDDGLFDTAVREAHEECGIVLDRSVFESELPPMLAGRHTGTPVKVGIFVFAVDQLPSLTLDPAEVASTHFLNESFFRCSSNHADDYEFPGAPGQTFPHVHLDGNILWGFTYNVLTAFLR